MGAAVSAAIAPAIVAFVAIVVVVNTSAAIACEVRVVESNIVSRSEMPEIVSSGRGRFNSERSIRQGAGLDGSLAGVQNSS